MTSCPCLEVPHKDRSLHGQRAPPPCARDAPCVVEAACRFSQMRPASRRTLRTPAGVLEESAEQEHVCTVERTQVVQPRESELNRTKPAPNKCVALSSHTQETALLGRQGGTSQLAPQQRLPSDHRRSCTSGEPSGAPAELGLTMPLQPKSLHQRQKMTENGANAFHTYTTSDGAGCWRKTA